MSSISQQKLEFRIMTMFMPAVLKTQFFVCSTETPSDSLHAFDRLELSSETKFSTFFII